jgi:hypothetical protein
MDDPDATRLHGGTALLFTPVRREGVDLGQ